MLAITLFAKGGNYKLVVQTRIADYMAKKGIKRSFVAEKTNIALSRVSAILNGNTELRADELEKICNALDVDSSEFIRRDSAE